MIYGLFSSIVLMGVGALAVDWGRVTVAKSELKSATDAAVRAGGMALLEGESTQQILLAARDTAQSNQVDGAKIKTVGQSIQLGVYVPETKNFYATNDADVANAVRVTLTHSFNQSNTPLFFARFITGKDSTVSTSSMVMVTDVPDTFVATKFTITVPGNSGSKPGSSTPATSTPSSSTPAPSTPAPSTPPAPKPPAPTAPAPTPPAPKPPAPTAPAPKAIPKPAAPQPPTPAKAVAVDEVDDADVEAFGADKNNDDPVKSREVQPPPQPAPQQSKPPAPRPPPVPKPAPPQSPQSINPPASNAPASNAPASNAPASNAPANKPPANSTPPSSTPASSTPASSTPGSSFNNPGSTTEVIQVTQPSKKKKVMITVN